MSKPISQETVLQAILELSNQLKETKLELKTEFKTEIVEVIENIKRLEEKVEMIDAKMDVLSQGLLTTQADVLRLKRA